MFEIRKAQRKKSKLRLALCGASGSGKTFSSLVIFSQFPGKICVIDTENSADLYAKNDKLLKLRPDFDYDILNLHAPFTPQRYIEAIEFCEKSGFENIIIDSLSHGWFGIGGACEMASDISRSSSNKNEFFAWSKVTPHQNKLMYKILTSTSHIIATMRSKSDTVLNTNKDGKIVPTKVGLKHVQRDGTDFEFTSVLDISQEHYAVSSKDRTDLFDGRTFVIGKETGEELIEWLNKGIDEESEKESKVLTMRDHFIEMINDATTKQDATEIAREGWREIKKVDYVKSQQYLDEIKKALDDKEINL